MEINTENKAYSDDITIESNGEMSEEKSVSLMRYDIGRIITELNAHTKKTRFKSLTITLLEQAEYNLWRELGNRIN